MRWIRAATVVLVIGPGVAHAHFALVAPPSYSMQDSLGTPLKSAPCGQADPGVPVVATGAVTAFHEGDMVWITINETVFHPGHYRVAIAADQVSLPADPIATPDGLSPCGTAEIQTSATPGVLADGMLDHSVAFVGEQSFQVALPAGMTCTNCTLQIVEFMSNHPLNVPGGCFYHHCAQLDIVPQGTPLPDAGAGATNDAGGTNGGTVTGGCDLRAVEPTSGVVVLAVIGILLRQRRTRAAR